MHDSRVPMKFCSSPSGRGSNPLSGSSSPLLSFLTSLVLSLTSSSVIMGHFTQLFPFFYRIL
eukprot:UN14788